MKAEIIKAMMAAQEIVELFEEQQEEAAKQLAESLLTDIGMIDEVDIEDSKGTMDFLKEQGYAFDMYVQERDRNQHEAILVVTMESRTIFVSGICVTLDLENDTITSCSVDFDDDQLKHFKEVTDRMDEKKKQKLH